MADLMNSSKTDFRKLAKTYNDFLVPAVKVKIGSNSYNSVTSKETKSGSGMIIDAVEAFLYHDEGSSVKVTVKDVYDREGSHFKNIASLGEKMSVEIGYGSTFSQIFSGFVGEIQYQYRGTRQYIRITGFDAVTLMAQNIRSRFYQKSKYSDIVSQIIKDYSSVLKAETIDSSGEQQQEVISGSCMSDYEYICNVLCPAAAKEFYIFNGKAYFQAVSKRNQTASVELMLGKGLYDFSLTSAYANLECKTGGLSDVDTDKVFQAQASGKADSSQKSAVSTAQVQYMPWFYAPDNATAKNCADYWTELNIARRQTAEGKCLGIPEIIPGRCIEVHGISDAWNEKKLWVSDVQHYINKKGFTTKFHVKGWS